MLLKQKPCLQKHAIQKGDTWAQVLPSDLHAGLLEDSLASSQPKIHTSGQYMNRPLLMSLWSFAPHPSY